MLQCATCYSVLPTGHSRPVTDNLLASFRDTVQVKPVTAGVHCGRGGITVGRGCLIIGIIVLASCVMCHAVFRSLNCISVFVSPSMRYVQDVTCLVMCNVYCVLYSVARYLGSGGCAAAGCRRPGPAPAPPAAAAEAGWARSRGQTSPARSVAPVHRGADCGELCCTEG